MTMIVIMARKRVIVGVADAKARFSQLLERVARGEQLIVARRGKPVAVLAPPEAVADAAEPHRGLASLAGVMEDWPEMERDMTSIVRSRRSARERPAPDLQ